jgi:hypothetical protein
MELVGNFLLVYRFTSANNTTKYSLIKLMQMVMFLLDVKKGTNGAPEGLISGLLLLLIYVNDLPNITDNDAKVVLFADDTSYLVTNSNQGVLQTALDKILSDII